MSNLHSAEIRELVHEPNNNIDCESGVNVEDIIDFPDNILLGYLLFLTWILANCIFTQLILSYFYSLVFFWVIDQYLAHLHIL